MMTYGFADLFTFFLTQFSLVTIPSRYQIHQIVTGQVHFQLIKTLSHHIKQRLRPVIILCSCMHDKKKKPIPHLFMHMFVSYTWTWRCSDNNFLFFWVRILRSMLRPAYAQPDETGSRPFIRNCTYPMLIIGFMDFSLTLSPPSLLFYGSFFLAHISFHSEWNKKIVRIRKWRLTGIKTIPNQVRSKYHDVGLEITCGFFYEAYA